MKYAVEQAFGYFQHVAESVGAPVTSVALSPDGIRIARVIRDRAELRLSWSPSLRRLALEINHGPPDGAAVGRLELFDARTSNDAFLEFVGVRGRFRVVRELRSGADGISDCRA